MTLTVEMEARGLKAYEQARAFERLRAWRLPLAYGVFVLIPVGVGILAVVMGHTLMAEIQIVTAGLFALGAWFQWEQLRKRYAGNLEILEEMEKAFGDQLPWVQVKNHFAELEKLQQELEAEKLRGPLK